MSSTADGRDILDDALTQGFGTPRGARLRRLPGDVLELTIEGPGLDSPLMKRQKLRHLAVTPPILLGAFVLGLPLPIPLRIVGGLLGLGAFLFWRAHFQRLVRQARGETRVRIDAERLEASGIAAHGPWRGEAPLSAVREVEVVGKAEVSLVEPLGLGRNGEPATAPAVKLSLEGDESVLLGAGAEPRLLRWLATSIQAALDAR